MYDKIMDYLTNPVKNKLLIEFFINDVVTVKMLAEKNKNIPQATLYRYVKKMLNDGIIKVVEERQVRNVTEKVYASNIDFFAGVDKMLEENSGETYLRLFQQFTIGLLNEFKAYSERRDIDIKKDGSGFKVSPFYATFEELQELSGKVWEVIEPYAANEPNPERDSRSVAVIFTPPTD